MATNGVKRVFDAHSKRPAPCGISLSLSTPRLQGFVLVHVRRLHGFRPRDEERRKLVSSIIVDYSASVGIGLDNRVDGDSCLHVVAAGSFIARVRLRSFEQKWVTSQLWVAFS